jgi:hypothetical protein
LEIIMRVDQDLQHLLPPFVGVPFWDPRRTKKRAMMGFGLNIILNFMAMAVGLGI